MISKQEACVQPLVGELISHMPFFVAWPEKKKKKQVAFHIIYSNPFWPMLELYKSVFGPSFFHLEWLSGYTKQGLVMTTEAEMQIQWVIIKNFPEY